MNDPDLLHGEDRKLLETFLTTITLSPNNTLRLFVIGFVGLPGTGKSTVATLLADRLHLPLSRSDEIRRFLNQQGFEGHSPRQEIMAAMAEARTQYYYKNKTSAVIDANFTEFASESRDAAGVAGAELILIETICPEPIVLERLAARSEQAANNSSSLITIKEYSSIKKRVQSFKAVTDIYSSIHTDQPIEPQIQKLTEKLRADRYTS